MLNKFMNGILNAKEVSCVTSQRCVMKRPKPIRFW